MWFTPHVYGRAEPERVYCQQCRAEILGGAYVDTGRTFCIKDCMLAWLDGMEPSADADYLLSWELRYQVARGLVTHINKFTIADE